MKKHILLIAIILGLMTLSCSSDDNDDAQKSEFQGAWAGTYSGDEDYGTWTANIDPEGKVTGTAVTAVYNASLQLNGNVSSSGAFTATVGSASNGAEFSGQMTETSGSGTWINTAGGISGTWSGNKQ